MTGLDRPAPLEGVKVLDLSRMYPGAFCTLLLADLGADVVKVEAPRFGDGLRMMAGPDDFNAAHAALNRGKRSVVVDLRNEAAADVLRPLVRWADVVVESNRPGQLDEKGIGYAALSAENPALVWCSVTGFGSDGPNATAPGHDLTYLGAAGVLGGLAEGTTTPPALTVSLPMAATMAAVGVLATLVDAIRSGRGRRVDVSMTDAASWIVSEDVARAANAPAPPWPTLAARNVYRCADGREVTVAATEPKTWAALCAGLDLPDLADHHLGVGEEEVIDRFAAVFATKPAADWVADPGLAGGVGPVHRPADLLHDPQFTDRGGFLTLDDGDAEVLASPVRIDGADGAASSAARTTPPELGTDADAVLTEAGFTPAEIEDLRAGGLIG